MRRFGFIAKAARLGVCVLAVALLSHPAWADQYERAPVEGLGSSDAPVLYIWMDGASFRNLLKFPGTATNIFVDSRTVPIYGWHTPLGALAENLGSRTNLPYGTVLVKVVLDRPEAIRSVGVQPNIVAKGELQYHVYAMPRIVQLHEWIFSSENIKEWSAFTDEIEQDLNQDLKKFRSGFLTRKDLHLYGARFAREGTIRAASKNSRALSSAQCHPSRAAKFGKSGLRDAVHVDGTLGTIGA